MGTSLIIFLIFGFALLIKGSDILTDAAERLARRLKIASFIIGVVIVGFGTSIPELIVAVFSNLQGFPQMSVGTIAGSNTFNILFILGISAIIGPLKFTKDEIKVHIPLNIIAVTLPAVFVMLSGSFFGLSRVGGLFLIALFFGWILYLRKANRELDENGSRRPGAGIKKQEPFVSLMLTVAGVLAVVVGGEWVVEAGEKIARGFGIHESVIGLTIVGAGTSLPELFAALVAAWKKNYGLALGNIIGSNIFDFLFILGLTASMKPIPFTAGILFDVWITAAAAGALFLALIFSKKKQLGREAGLIFLFGYIAYIGYLLTARMTAA